VRDAQGGNEMRNINFTNAVVTGSTVNGTVQVASKSNLQCLPGDLRLEMQADRSISATRFGCARFGIHAGEQFYSDSCMDSYPLADFRTEQLQAQEDGWQVRMCRPGRLELFPEETQATMSAPSFGKPNS